MTDQQAEWIGQLSRCRFQPGSWDRRFVRDLASFPREQELTEKQAAALARLAWRYRKQRGEPQMARPHAAVQPTTEDLQRLADWNEGKPRGEGNAPVRHS